MLTNTFPSNTTGWMSIPAVGVAVTSRAQISSPVTAWRATTPVDPRSPNTRPSATATPKGPMSKPFASVCQRGSPVSRSSALMAPPPRPSWMYTVSPTISGTVESAPSISWRHATCRRRMLFASMADDDALRLLS